MNIIELERKLEAAHRRITTLEKRIEVILGPDWGDTGGTIKAWRELTERAMNAEVERDARYALTPEQVEGLLGLLQENKPLKSGVWMGLIDLLRGKATDNKVAVITDYPLTPEMKKKLTVSSVAWQEAIKQGAKDHIILEFVNKSVTALLVHGMMRDDGDAFVSMFPYYRGNMPFKHRSHDHFDIYVEDDKWMCKIDHKGVLKSGATAQDAFTNAMVEYADRTGIFEIK